jgi:hypothetical protein
MRSDEDETRTRRGRVTSRRRTRGGQEDKNEQEEKRTRGTRGGE